VLALDGRDKAHGQADGQLTQNGSDHQQQARGQARHDQLAHLGALYVGAAEITGEQVRQVAPVLHDEGLIEPELLADVLDGLGRGAATGYLAYRVSRQQVEQREGDDRHAEQDKRGLD
jgi:hypothetical protein